jgi:dTDP-4-amino-4,6-dideoxygalactose transaminase
MSNICAGIGRGQMKVIDERVTQRRNNFLFYKNEFSKVEGIAFVEEPKGHFSNRWLTTIIIDPQKTGGITREALRLSLENENIESRPLWKPMHLQPIFSSALFYGTDISEKLFDDGLCLPSGSNLLSEELDRIASIIHETLKK